MSFWKKVGGNLSNTWKEAGADISDTWKKAVDDITDEVMRTPGNIKKLSAEARKAALDYLAAQGLTPPIVGDYFAYLDSQANGKWKRLPKDIQRILDAHYPKVDMSEVRYCENIDTVHGRGITVDNKIYFPQWVNFYTPADFYWLLHELEHVGQYRVVGGRDAFLVKYLFQGGLEIFGQGSINVHDSIPLEQDAINKSERIFDSTYQQVIKLSEGWFWLKNRASGKALDLHRPHINKNGGKIHQWDYGSGLHQQWKIEDAGGGWFWLKNRASGKALDLHRPDIDKNGGKIHQWDYGEGAHQQWRIEDVGGGWFWLKNRASGKALDLHRPHVDKNGGKIHQWDYGSGPHQQWRRESI